MRYLSFCRAGTCEARSSKTASSIFRATVTIPRLRGPAMVGRLTRSAISFRCTGTGEGYALRGSRRRVRSIGYCFWLRGIGINMRNYRAADTVMAEMLRRRYLYIYPGDLYCNGRLRSGVLQSSHTSVHLSPAASITSAGSAGGPKMRSISSRLMSRLR